MEELTRRMASSTSWGIEGARLLTPAEVKEMVPFIDETVILGGFYTPGVGDRRLAPGRDADAPAGAGAWRVDRRGQRRGQRHRRRGRPCARRPDGSGRHRDRHRRHRLRRLEPADRGDGRSVDPADAGRPPDDRHRAGAALRAHDQARSGSRSSGTWTRTCTSGSTGPASRSARTPIGRSSWSPTTSHRSRRRPCLRPMLPFTKEDFDPQLEDALELFPEIVGDERSA